MERPVSIEDQNEISALAKSSIGVASNSLHTAIQQLICDSEHSITSIDLERARLRRQQNSHIIRIQQLRGAIAAHRKLPNELLADIFLRCTGWLEVPWNLQQAPWSFARVCSRWRQIAHNTPLLWSKILVCPPPNGTFCCVDMLEHLLVNRSTSFISVRIDIDPDRNASWEALKLASLLALHSKRLEFVFLRGHATLMHEFLSLPMASMPNLQSLHIEPWEEFKPNSLSAIHGAHSLRSLSLSYMLLDDITPFIDVSLSRLTHLSLDKYTISFNIAFQILTRCGSLVSCSMDLASQWESSQRDGRPQYAVLTLPELKKLSICLIDSTNALWIPYLSLPNLTSFQIISRGFDLFWPTTWTGAITGLGALEILLIMGVIVPTTEIEEVLEATPMLTELKIEFGEMLSNSILRRLSSGELVPCLSSFFCCLESAESLTRHLDMLEARKAEGTATHIEKVVFGNYPNLPTADIEDRIERMNTEGWKIGVDYDL